MCVCYTHDIHSMHTFSNIYTLHIFNLIIHAQVHTYVYAIILKMRGIWLCVILLPQICISSFFPVMGGIHFTFYSKLSYRTSQFICQLLSILMKCLKNLGNELISRNVSCQLELKKLSSKIYFEAFTHIHI